MKKKKLEAKLSETKKALKKMKSKLDELTASTPGTNEKREVTGVIGAEPEAAKPIAIKKPAARAARK